MVSNQVIHATIGAAVTIFVSIFLFAVPVTNFSVVLSPLFGAVIVSWFWESTKKDGARLGALSGVITSLILFPVALLGFGTSEIVGFMLVIVWVLVSVYLTFFSTLGGVLGSTFTNSTPQPERTISYNTNDDIHNKCDRRSGIERLRQRYMAGELTEEEFERNVDHIMETNRVHKDVDHPKREMHRN